MGPELVLDITDASASPTQSFEAFDTVQMTVFDFHGDGVKEIVAKNDNNWIYVFDGRTGALLAEMRDGVPSKWGYRELAGVAIGDVDGDGAWDIVSASSAGTVTVWELEAANSTSDRLDFRKAWSKHLDPDLVDPSYRKNATWLRNESTGFDGAPYLADADGDGADEIFLQADNLAGHWALRGDGSVLWARFWDDGNANPWVADLDRDGRLEVVYATDAGRVWVYDAKSGAYRWSFNVADHGARPGSISLAPGLVDINGDGRLEVVFGTRVAVENKSDPDWMLKMHTMIFALSSKGQLLWNRSFEWGEPHVYMMPAAADVDGDGVDEALFVDWNTIGHKPGNWETTGPPNLFAINGEGEVLFHVKVSTYWSNKNVVVADIDADGTQDILVNEGGTIDGIGIYDLRGKRKGSIELPWAASRGPLVTDLEGDGSMQLIVPVSKRRTDANYREVDVGYRAGRIVVYDLGVPYAAAWDNVFLFNHRLDHLYGGEAKPGEREVIDMKVQVLDDAPLRLRVESDHEIASVTARPVPDGPMDELTRDANGTWNGRVSGTRFDVTVRFDNGAFLTRIVDSPHAPTPPTPTPTSTTPTPTTATSTPTSPTPDEVAEARTVAAPAFPALVLVALVALGLARRSRK